MTTPESQPNISSLEDESPAFILGEWMRRHYQLEDQGQWVYTIGSMPDDIANRVVLTDTTPVLQVRGMRTGKTSQRPGIQVRLRSMSYQLGYRKIKGIQNTFDSLYHEEIQIETEIVTINTVHQVQGILPLGKDERERWNFTLNVTVKLTY